MDYTVIISLKNWHVNHSWNNFVNILIFQIVKRSLDNIYSIGYYIKARGSNCLL